MLPILLVVQVIIAVAMVGVILVQRSSSDGTAGLVGGGSGNSLLSGRASSDLLTKSTAILATAFMVNSLAMATLTSRSQSASDLVIEQLSEDKPVIEEAIDVDPSVPIAE